MSTLIIILVAIGSGSSGYLIGHAIERRRAERRLLIIDRFCLAARNCAGKLRAELMRGTISPRTEYENLIDEAAKRPQKPVNRPKYGKRFYM